MIDGFGSDGYILDLFVCSPFVRKGQWWKSSFRESQDELSRLNEERWATWLKVA